MADTQRISVVGLGLMGSALARGLLAAGHEVTVWNRTPVKATPLAASGAVVAPDLAAALGASPVSLWCLLDYPTMAQLLADDAVRAALAGTTVIPSATGGPDDVELLAKALDAAGATVLDAKIMFFPAQVGDDDAELLLSGSAAAFERYRGLLDDVAGASRYLGPDVTAASVLYTAVWAYDFAARFAFMEAAALVEASGLHLEEFAASAGRRTARFGAQNAELLDRFTRDHFDGDQASVDIYAEGIAPMLGAFAKVAVPAHLLEAVGRYATAAQQAGYGSKDVAVVFDMLRSHIL